jgi:hypothetical protein
LPACPSRRWSAEQDGVGEGSSEATMAGSASILGLASRLGSGVEHTEKSDPWAWKKKRSESPRYTTVDSVRHALVRTESINLPGLRAAASSAGVVGEMGVQDAMHLSGEHISGCALEHGEMRQVETKIKEATH